MLSKLRLIFKTISYLKFIQVYYQVYYKIRGRLIRRSRYANLKGYASGFRLLDLHSPNVVPEATSVVALEEDHLRFTFINLTKELETSQIDWNFLGHGKLWNYNLNYFDFLFLPDFNQRLKTSLIQQYCEGFDRLKDGLEPYPVSIRCINWIKFFSLNHLNNQKFDEFLFRQYKVLLANLEFHLLANHLLENAFSLLFGAYYFRNETFYSKAKKILLAQLKEQILVDGGHFERSPMYHQIVLYRLLECYDLVVSNPWKDDELREQIKAKAEHMLSWLKAVTFSNGDVPYMKDAAPRIAPSSETLFNFASDLGLNAEFSSRLNDSGYRFLESTGLELVADIGSIGPSYQPGHAHADELNFYLYANSHPVIVETGTSTYAIGKRRQKERSTEAHNSLSLGGRDSSEVWGGFRVANRAKVKVTKDRKDEVEAEHDGFQKYGIVVKRNFRKIDGGFELKDSFHGKPKNDELIRWFLHFYPGISPEIRGTEINLDRLIISLNGFKEAKVETYKFAAGFNDLRSAYRIALIPNKETQITIKNAG